MPNAAEYSLERRPLRAALDALATAAARAATTSRALSDPDLVRLRDVRRADRDLFDFIFALQDHSYRRNHLTKGLVWSYDAFVRRSDDYVVFGRLPARDRFGRYPSVPASIEQQIGFVLGRMLPRHTRSRAWLKLSAMAGHPEGIMSASADALASGFPVVAAVDPRLARIAVRAGFKTLSPRVARWVAPLVAPAFLQAPWTYHGVDLSGALQVTHPGFLDAATGARVVYSKTIVLSPGALRWLLRPSGLTTTVALVANSRPSTSSAT